MTHQLFYEDVDVGELIPTFERKTDLMNWNRFAAFAVADSGFLRPNRLTNAHMYRPSPSPPPIPTWCWPGLSLALWFAVKMAAEHGRGWARRR